MVGRPQMPVELWVQYFILPPNDQTIKNKATIEETKGETPI